jgi:hypothetical protein
MLGGAGRGKLSSAVMPQPLPDTVVATLRTDPCAALAAIVIISNAHSELLAWAQRAISGCPPPSAVGGKAGAKANGAGGSNGVAGSDGAPGQAPRINSAGGGRAKGRDTSREAAAKHDQALLALMHANPHATVTEIIRMNGRPRNSTVLSLDRLEKAGLIEHAGRGKWKVMPPGSDPGADLLDPRTPGSGGKAAGWIEPLSANRKARHAADGRVRDELTMAASAQ